MEKPLDRLLYWAREREQIRLLKDGGLPRPWTNDPILQTYRFCNVRRRDDRVSQWLIQNWLQKHFTHDKFAFLQIVALGRWVNWPPTLKVLDDMGLVTYGKLDLREIGKTIDSIQKHEKAWTGAYMIRAPKGGKISKGKFVAEIVIGELEHHRADLEFAMSHPSVELMWQALHKVNNFGPFMAGQVVADLTYTGYLARAVDLFQWAPQGPGSRRGYNRMMGLPLKHPAPDQMLWNHTLQDWRAEVLKVIGGDPYTFTLHDMQNCLCEFDKYERTRLGEGRPRSTYEPETAF